MTFDALPQQQPDQAPPVLPAPDVDEHGGGLSTSSTTPAPAPLEAEPETTASGPQAEAISAAADQAVATPVPDDVEDLQDEFHDFDDLFDQQNEISMITEAQPEEEEEAAIMVAPVAPRTELDRALRDVDALD